MCFGQTVTGTKTTEPSPLVQNAGQTAWDVAARLGTQAFNAPLQGTAGFNPMQTQGWGSIAQMAANPNNNNPFYNQEANAFAAYGAAPASQISAPSVLGSNVNPATATLNQYIDPNLQLELQPTLDEITRQANIAKTGAGGVGSQATAAGAFGDARQGVENANVDEAAMRQAAQATAGAYQNAFTNAANLRGVDVSNIINTGTTNANLNEQALQRLLGSGNALQNLAGFQTGQGLNLAQAAIAGGTQQQQNIQQALNATYNQQLQNLLGPYQYQIPALNSALSALNPSQPSTTTTTAPNNALYAMLGPLAGAAPSLIGGIGSGLGSVFGSFGSLFGGAAAGGGAGAMTAIP